MSLKLSSAVFLLVASCSSAGVDSRSCSQLAGADEVDVESLVEEVEHDSALERFLSSAPEVLGMPDTDLVQYFEGEWVALAAAQHKGARVYWFKGSKGALGWRQGLVATRGCRAVDAVTLIEDN